MLVASQILAIPQLLCASCIPNPGNTAAVMCKLHPSFLAIPQLLCASCIPVSWQYRSCYVLVAYQFPGNTAAVMCKLHPSFLAIPQLLCASCIPNPGNTAAVMCKLHPMDLKLRNHIFKQKYCKQRNFLSVLI